MTAPERPRTIWFHRAYKATTGGEVKHAHYFAHARQMPGFAARVAFTGGPLTEGQTRERRRLWPVGGGDGVAGWTPAVGDILFVAGIDWRYLSTMGLDGTNHPRINLVQHVRHAQPDTELYGYLTRRAVRICVSAEVADALAASGRVRGPIIALPNATDLPPWDVHGSAANTAWETRPRSVAIVGYKRPDLARALSERLDAGGIAHDLLTRVQERGSFLEVLTGTRVVVCLPDPTEGFYLPAIEAMACGCLVVTLDAVGNRGFCHDGHNCFVGEAAVESLAGTVAHAVVLSREAREEMLARASETVAAHALDVERSRFHRVLGDVGRLWEEAQRDSYAVSTQATESAPEVAGDAPVACPTPYRPRLAFMIAGAQKCGTTALVQFLDAHPEIGMSSLKEVHLFDDPQYSSDWSAEEIDERYRPHFAHCRFTGLAGETVLGEATPVYLFLRGVPAELKRYNPELRLIVLVRDPVERAISHYYMEKGRAGERRPLWQALLLEPIRLRRSRDPRHPQSAHRVHSYRARGLYSRQLREVYRFFDKDHVLVLRTEDLLAHHDEVLRRVFGFLQVSCEVRVPAEVVLAGERGGRKHRFVSLLLRLSYLVESARMRRLREKE